MTHATTDLYLSDHNFIQVNFALPAFGTSTTDITAIQDVINDRFNLTLEQVISRIQRDLENRNHEGIAVPVKTVCERYFTSTAVSNRL